LLTIFYLSWAAVKRIEKFFFYNPGFSPKTSRATIFILGFLLNFPALQTPLVEMNQLLQKYFGFDPATTTIRTEIIAGVSTFLTMAYILAVNPAILGITGMDKGALFATTAITSGIATLIMALYAKMPFGLAPGMGINAFFAYTVCLSMGHTWQFALTAVLPGRSDIHPSNRYQYSRKDRLFPTAEYSKSDWSGYWSFYCLYRSAKCRNFR